MEFPRKVSWSVLPLHTSGDLPDPGIEPVSIALQADSLPLNHQGIPGEIVHIKLIHAN